MAESKIREALELLDGGRRWTQYVTGEKPNGSMCMMVALGRACGIGGHQFVEDRNAVKQVVLDNYGWHCAALWNDLPTTTFADVEAVMEKAAVMREGAIE